MAHMEVWMNNKLHSSYKSFDQAVDFVTCLIYKEDHLREKYRPYVKGNGFDDPLFFYYDGLRNSVFIKFVSDEDLRKKARKDLEEELDIAKEVIFRQTMQINSLKNKLNKYRDAFGRLLKDL